MVYTLGVWYHIAVTFEGGTQYLYINGELAASASLGGVIDFTTGNQWYWNTSLGSGASIVGHSCDARVSNIARTGDYYESMYRTANGYIDSVSTKNVENFSI